MLGNKNGEIRRHHVLGIVLRDNHRAGIQNPDDLAGNRPGDAGEAFCFVGVFAAAIRRDPRLQSNILILAWNLKHGIGDRRFGRSELQAFLQKGMRSPEKGVHRNNEPLGGTVGFCEIEHPVRSILGPLRDRTVSRLEVGVHIGPAKRIDRLLGVADEHQTAVGRTEKYLLEDFKLPRVCVL